LRGSAGKNPAEMSTPTLGATQRYTVREKRPPRSAPRACSSTPGRRSSVTGVRGSAWLPRLRRALREDLFVLHFQPIVWLGDRSVSHYEALLRLTAPDGAGLIAPGRFLPAAERYGLIPQIDRMVISKVSALMGGELLAPCATVAINLSGLSITDEGMLTHIERELDAHAVDPRRLIVEVTETAAISNMRRASAFCERAQELGCAVALDDFGAGFGSFHYLKRLSFSYLKIDGDFVRALPDSPNDQLVVKALVGVARGMGKRTIAEFVGDEPTIELLREFGVDYAQGFQLGRPQPLAAVRSAL
jgi:EAL domain-containing protein (putative c-di-GMP-specific phosphodiesterase class I)